MAQLKDGVLAIRPSMKNISKKIQVKLKIKKLNLKNLKRINPHKIKFKNH